MLNCNGIKAILSEQKMCMLVPNSLIWIHKIKGLGNSKMSLHYAYHLVNEIRVGAKCLKKTKTLDCSGYTVSIKFDYMPEYLGSFLNTANFNRSKRILLTNSSTVNAIYVISNASFCIANYKHVPFCVFSP